MDENSAFLFSAAGRGSAGTTGAATCSTGIAATPISGVVCTAGAGDGRRAVGGCLSCCCWWWWPWASLRFAGCSVVLWGAGVPSAPEAPPPSVGHISASLGGGSTGAGGGGDTGVLPITLARLAVLLDHALEPPAFPPDLICARRASWDSFLFER